MDNSVAINGCGSYRRTRAENGGKGLGSAGFHAAKGNEEKVVGLKRDVGHFACQERLEVNGDFGAGLRAEDGAHDAGVTRIGETVEAFGQGENLEGGEMLVFAQDKAAGFADGADDVDELPFGHGDDVFGFDLDVFGGALGVHHPLDIDAGDAVAATGIVSGVREWHRAPFETARDFDGVTGVLADATGQGNYFQESFVAFQLVYAGVLDCAEDGDGLAARFDQIDGDVGVLEVVLKALFEEAGELFGGKTGGVDAADHGQGDVTAGVDADGGGGGDFFFVESFDHELVVYAEGVGCVGGLGWWGRRRGRLGQAGGREA